MPAPATPTAPVSAAHRRYRGAAAVLVLVAADVALDPAHRHLPLCPLHALTGWWCPFCGGLRAVAAAARGHLAAAARDNLLLVLAPAVAAAWWAWARPRPGRGPRHWPRTATVALVAVVALFTVVRNLPGAAALRP